MKQLKFWKYASCVLAFYSTTAMAGSMALAQPVADFLSGLAKDYQIHGFASLGYIKTDENHFYGDSDGSGSFDYYELGLNGYLRMSEKLSASGQLLARDAGETDDGKIRIDYLFLDYRFINMDAAQAGARIGRVKNPIGFYNESRDVVFTRPSILLPQSIYLEGTGVRELLFSSDGAQLYSDWDHDRHHTSFKMNFAKTDDVSRQTRRNFVGDGGGFTGFTLDEMRISDMFFAQVLDEVDGGKYRFGLSYLTATLAAEFTSPQLPGPLSFAIDADIVVLSAQYNQEQWSLTSEYSLTTSKFDFAGGSGRGRSEGIYLQGQYRFTNEWTGLLRYDLDYADRNDRGGSDAKDLTMGFRWAPSPSWVVMGEYHYIHGSNGASSLPVIDNPQGASNHTNLLAVMLGYRF